MASAVVACGGVKSRQTCKYLSLDYTLNKNGPGMPTRARANFFSYKIAVRRP